MPVLRSEVEIERDCRDAAKEAGCILLKVIGQRGWPDRILLAPPGQAMFMEFKSSVGEVRPLQEHRLEKLREMGFRAEVVRSMTQFVGVLRTLSSRSSGSPGSTRSGG